MNGAGKLMTRSLAVPIVANKVKLYIGYHLGTTPELIEWKVVVVNVDRK